MFYEHLHKSKVSVGCPVAGLVMVLEAAEHGYAMTPGSCDGLGEGEGNALRP